MLKVDIKKTKKIVDIKKEKVDPNYFKSKTNLEIKPTMKDFRI